MDSLRGPVCDVRHSASVSGGADQTVTTTHIAIFRINGQLVRASANEPLLIRDGDELVVVGAGTAGVFRALAYHNRTTGVRGSDGWLVRMLFGALFCLVGLWMAGQVATAAGSALLLAVAAVLVGISALTALRGMRILSAVKRLRAETLRQG
jgi:hypothetical protein